MFIRDIHYTKDTTLVIIDVCVFLCVFVCVCVCVCVCVLLDRETRIKHLTQCFIINSKYREVAGDRRSI